MAATVTSYTIDGLEEGAAYRVSVAALVGANVGTAATVDARTGDNTDLSDHSLHPTPGQVITLTYEITRYTQHQGR